MSRMNLLRSKSAAIFRAALGWKAGIIVSIAANSRAKEPLGPTQSSSPQPTKRRILSLRGILFGGIAALWATTAMAQSHTVYVQPLFLYEFYNVQCCAYGVTSSTPPATWGTLSAAWAWSQAAINGTYNGDTATAVDLISPTGTIVQNGNPTWYDFSVQICNSGSCYTYPNIGYIQGQIVCPQNSGAGDYYYSPPNQTIACAITVYDVQPPPKNCKSCIGNPIYAATGQKLQVETDYSGPSGLNFTRTYRSNNGFFASVLTQGFVDNSVPAGNTAQQCYPAHWVIQNQSGFSCFPYMSVYPYVNSGIAQYQLQTDDGRSINFTGPNSAVTAVGDINERVTLSTSGGAKWQVIREDDSVELYNAAGSLIQKTLRGGQTFTYTYSTTSTPASVAPTPGLLLTESDAFGHTLSWQYNAGGQMIQMTDPTGGIYQYSYTNGNLTGVTYPDGSSKSYWYNESANTGGASLPTALTGITDENGVRYATFQYNSAGLAVNTQHSGGVESYTINYPYTAYTGQNYTATVTDPLGTARTYNFSGDGLSYNLDTSQTQPAASGTGTVSQSETYDAHGNPATLTDYNGNVTHYVYDLTRNLETSRAEAYGTAQARTTTTTWDPSWRQPDLITEPNRTTSFAYDALGNVLTKTITDTTVSPNVARTWTYTYDSYGRMLTADGPRTDVLDVTTYSYYTCTTGYQCGEIHTVTDALGHVTTFNTYNAHGQPLTITDPNGILTTLTYDARLRILSRQIGTETTGYSYYPTGLLKLVTMPDSSTLQYTYDNAHRLTRITDGAGNYVSYTLDAMGNHTQESSYDPSGTLHRTHTRVFNALNELYQDINAAGTAAVTTTFGYDNDGNRTSTAAPLSRNTGDQYDALNRLTQITDPNSGVTRLGYDANDNLASVIDPRNLTTSYSHNGFGDVTQRVSPDSGTSTSTYDSAGNLKTTTDARSAVGTYTYDALNRVTQVAYSDQAIQYTYDAGTNGVGHLTGASDAYHSMSWAYDAHGRVTGKAQSIGSVTKSVGYGYTNADMTSMVTPSGQTITYGYTNHQITSIAVNGTTVISGVTYDPFGSASGWTWGNGTTTTRAFDEDGNPQQIVTAGVTNSYTVDSASRITGLSDSGLTSNSFTFGYDALDRVTSGTSSTTTRGYTYDANGNWLSETGTQHFTTTISGTSNQLNSTAGQQPQTFTYDAAGNTTSYNGATFTFYQRGRFSSRTVTGGTTYYYYNAMNEMIGKSGWGGN